MSSAPGVPAAAEARALVRELLGGEATHQDLKERPGDCRVARLLREPSPHVILKLWNRPGLFGWLRRVTRTSPAVRERVALLELAGAGVRVPRPLGIAQISDSGIPYTEVLVLEDLGDCAPALERLKALIREGREEEVESLLEEVVELTGRMIEAGVVDRDHSFVNIVVTPAGHVARLDLEIAGGLVPSSFRRKRVGEMLGRLIATYTFAVQPELERVTKFATQLQARVGLPAPVLAQATRVVESMIETQLRTKGIHSIVHLPWDAS